MRLYREFTDQESLDAAYDPSRSAADAAGVMAAWQVRSAQAVARLDGLLDMRYGPTLAEHVDVYPAGNGAPVHLFVHGGYWRRFTARDFAWVAEPLVARGVAAVIVNYALCPAVSLLEIVRQVRAAVAWCHRHVPRFGGDPARLSLSGHSAGGHLVAMALATDWPGDYGLPATLVERALTLSGLFDLRPFPYTYLQPALQLTMAEVLQASPIDLAPAAATPLTVAVGSLESSEFRRQSRDFLEAWRGHGVPTHYAEVADADHFTALDRLFAPKSPLLDAVLGGHDNRLAR
jgi:arylformamidase